MAHYELIVIGAGPGGYEAALHAAKLGKKVAVVEKREAGGTCLNRGCIPTKTLLHSSQIFHDAKHGAHAGIHTDDIRADMTEIFAYKREISQKLSSGIESLFKTAKIDFLRGTALITAPGAVRVTDAEGGANDYTCDDILIATGSEVLTLRHEARDRALFADGAMQAARFLVGKPAGLYTMQDLINREDAQ